MKHHIRTLACGAVLLAAIVMIACGGKETMASKSAAAYDEAKKKGIPIEAGEHGGHSNETDAPADHAAMPEMDHSQMPGMKHGDATSGAQAMAAMDHSAMAQMDHSMPGMKHGATSATHDMAGMDHSRMPGMQHSSTAAGAHDMAGMNHSAMPGMEHGSTPTMQHGGTMAAMPGMQHGSPAAAPITIPPPASNAAIAQTQPAATLRPDQFDAPAPAAIEEAAKGASGTSHSMEKAAPKSPAQPKPQPPSDHHHGGGEAS